MIHNALGYAFEGWPVFPCQQGDKRPATTHGVKDATTNTDQIDLWWDRNPSYNIGIATGQPSGLLVIDIDMHGQHNGISAWWEITAGKDLEQWATYWVTTPSGGWHLYYATTSDVKNTSGILAPGIDTRGTGGYVIAPPSVIAGNPYAKDHHLKSMRPKEAPAWLLDLLAPSCPVVPLVRRRNTPAPMPHDTNGTPYGHKGLTNELEQLAATPEGRRNEQLNIAAFNLGQLVGSLDLAEDWVIVKLEIAAEGIGLDPSEIAATITSGLTKGKQTPR